MPGGVRRLLDAMDPGHRRILDGMVKVALFVLLGKFAAAGRDMAVAWRFGTGESVDVYVFAFTMATWIPGIWTAVLHMVYVPLAGRLGREGRDRFAAQLHGATLAASALLSLAAVFGLPALLRALATGFGPEALAELDVVGRQLAPLAGLGVLIAFYSAILLALERHANTLAEAVPALCMLVAVLAWPHAADAGPLVAGVLVGTALQAALLYRLLATGGDAPPVAVPRASEGWGLFRDAMGFMVLSQVVFGLQAPIDQYLAASLGTGSVATLSYAQRLLSLAIGLGATAVGRAILPVLSDEALSVARRFRVARTWFALLLAAGAVGVGLGWVLAPFGVRLVFEHGAFDAQDTAAVSQAVRWGLLQLPFYFSSIVLVQLFASLGRYRIIAASVFLPIALKLALGPWLAARYGVAGVMLSTVMMYAVNGVYYWVMLVREERRETGLARNV